MTDPKRLPVLYCDGHRVVIADSDEKVLPGNIWVRYEPAVPRCATCEHRMDFQDGQFVVSYCPKRRGEGGLSGIVSSDGYCDQHPEAKR